MMIGQVISHYRILEKLGEGGMGVVYKAEDTRLKRFVALKFLSRHVTADETDKARFMQEARAAAVLNHPNVCTVYDVAEHDRPFIVMEYVEGKSLREHIYACLPKALNFRIVLKYVIQTAEALHAAHEAGIVHRDIKSENIMITKKGRVKVMDFGLAKLKGAAGLTRTGTTAGTLAYVSPEQLQGKDTDARSDIFSFGVMFYEMLTGELPFQGEYESATIYSILNEEPKPVREISPDVPSGCLQILKRALQKDPANRYQSMSGMLIDLKRLRAGTLKSIDTPSTRKTSETEKKHLNRVGISAAILFFCFISVVLFKWVLFEKISGVSPVPIAVMGFENLTGDASYDYLKKVIPNLLITDLEQSEYLQVTTWERMRDLLRQRGDDALENIDQESCFELCRRDSVNVIVLGSVLKAGTLFITDVKVLDVQSKTLIKSARTQGEGESSIIRSQIDFLSREISRGIGLSDRKIRGTQRPVPDVTTRSIDAYRYFVRGKEETNRKYFREALSHFKMATAADSSFAIAYAWLADTYDNLGYAEQRNDALQKAVQLRENATDKEKYFIDFLEAYKFEGNRKKAEEVLKKSVERYPREKWSHYMLGVFNRMDKRYQEALGHFSRTLALDPDYGPALNETAYRYFMLKDYEKALEYFNRYAAVSPGNADPLDSMAELYFAMGQLDDALLKYKEAVGLKPDYPCYWKIAYIHALKEDYTQALYWISRYALNCPPPKEQNIAFIWKLFYYGWLGRFTDAFNLITQWEQLTGYDSEKQESASLAWMTGWLHMQTGDCQKASGFFKKRCAIRRNHQPQLASFCQAETWFQLGLIDLQQEEVDSAKSRLIQVKSLLKDIAPDDFEKIEFAQHFLKTEILLAEQKTDPIIDSHRNAALPSGTRLLSWTSLYNNAVFRRDAKARAWLIRGEPENAIREYEKLVSFNLSGENRSLIHPLTHYRLAMLYEASGKPEKAAAAYRRFLDIWGDADENLPQVVHAKKHYHLLMQFISLNR